MTVQGKKIELIGYDCGWGTRDWGCEDGPAQANAEKLMFRLRHYGYDPVSRGGLSAKFLGRAEEHEEKNKTLSHVVESAKRLCNHVGHALAQGRLPFVIGGDHSSAMGTWPAVTTTLKARENFGLIWIDAHLDSHTNETSKSGKYGGWWHGQCVTSLMNLNDATALNNIGGAGAKISPKHLCFIGTRSFEPEEKAFVEKHNIRVYDMDAVRKRGFGAVFKEAVEHVTAGTAGFGMTIDLDAFDPSEAPGVGSIEENGLLSADVLPIVQSIAHHSAFRALEIVEFNPHKDKDHKTRQLIEKLVGSIFAPA
jgi:arginase